MNNKKENYIETNTMQTENNSIKCLEKYIKEVRQIREQYNKQLDGYINELEKLKKKPGTKKDIDEMFRTIKQVIKNEHFSESLIDAKIKQCVCKTSGGGKGNKTLLK